MMKIAVFSSASYTVPSFERANVEFGHELVFFEPRLTAQTVPLAAGYPVVCAFVNDELDATVLHGLAGQGTRMIALRCAGFNNVDLIAAERLGLLVTRVPAYSPHAVAEHTVTLMLALNRKLHRAYARVRENNFSLEGLVGFDMRDRTVGIVGTGRIGLVVAEILRGFGCQLLGYDAFPSEAARQLGVEYVLLPELFARSDIITLHCPLSLATHHLLDAKALARMRDGVMVINTSRGALIDTHAVIDGLKRGKITALGLDVYEEEADLFYQDLSDQVIQDDVFARLLTFPNVIITAHQAFLTEHALGAIARTTLDNVARFERGETAVNRVGVEHVLQA